MKLSMKYRVLRACMKAAGVKKQLAGTKEEILKAAKAGAAKKKIPQLESPDLDAVLCGLRQQAVVPCEYDQPHSVFQLLQL